MYFLSPRQDLPPQLRELCTIADHGKIVLKFLIYHRSFNYVPSRQCVRCSELQFHECLMSELPRQCNSVLLSPLLFRSFAHYGYFVTWYDSASLPILCCCVWHSFTRPSNRRRMRSIRMKPSEYRFLLSPPTILNYCVNRL